MRGQGEWASCRGPRRRRAVAAAAAAHKGLQAGCAALSGIGRFSNRCCWGQQGPGCAAGAGQALAHLKRGLTGIISSMASSGPPNKSAKEPPSGRNDIAPPPLSSLLATPVAFFLSFSVRCGDTEKTPWAAPALPMKGLRVASRTGWLIAPSAPASVAGLRSPALRAIRRPGASPRAAEARGPAGPAAPPPSRRRHAFCQIPVARHQFSMLPRLWAYASGMDATMVSCAMAASLHSSHRDDGRRR